MLYRIFSVLWISLRAEVGSLRVLHSTSSVGSLNLKQWLHTESQMPSVKQNRIEAKHINSTSVKNFNVAILTSGTLKRYMLQQAVSGLLGPLASQGHNVDYFLALNMEDFQAWQNGANAFQPDLELLRARTEVYDFINESVSKSGANLRKLLLVDNVSISDPMEKEFIATAKWNERRARKNYIKYLKMFDKLKIAMQEQERRSGEYDLVIIVIDDAIWLQPFNLNGLLTKKTSSGPHAWNLHCDGPLTTYKVSSSMLTNYIFVLDRKGAEPFLSQYDILLYDSESASKYWEFSNMETFLKTLSDEYAITVTSVSPDLMALQRAGRISVEGTQQVCLHKVCDTEGLRPLSYYPLC